MDKDANGVWTVTTQPLPPAIYNYYFDVGSQWRLDPANTHIAVKFQNVTNLLAVPGATPQLWDPTDVPHGEIHHHFYTSSVVLNLPGNQSDYYIYTPPGYSSASKTTYPVLYLLHGFNEGPYSWTAVGKANYILDNLLAQGKIKPMIVVMPLGYGDLNYVTTSTSRRDPALAAVRSRPQSAGQREHDRGHFRSRIGMRQVAPNRAAVAYLRVRDMRQGLVDERQAACGRRMALKVPISRQRSDA